MDVLAKLIEGDDETWQAWLDLLAPKLRRLVTDMVGEANSDTIDEFTAKILIAVVQTIHQTSEEPKPPGEPALTLGIRRGDSR